MIAGATMTPPQTTHPLDRLTAEEIDRARSLCAQAGLIDEHTRFAYLGLDEPAKQEVLGWQPGAPAPDRRIRAVLLQLDTGTGRDLLISLTEGKIIRDRLLDAGVDGQP